MTDESMIERVARAIYEAFPPRRIRKRPDDHVTMAPPWEEVSAYWRKASIAEARAAIAAMREPTSIEKL